MAMMALLYDGCFVGRCRRGRRRGYWALDGEHYTTLRAVCRGRDCWKLRARRDPGNHSGSEVGSSVIRFQAPQKSSTQHQFWDFFQYHVYSRLPTSDAMPKSLEKTRKRISKKKGDITVLHENSRDSQRLRRAQMRDDKLVRVAAARRKTDQPLRMSFGMLCSNIIS